MLQRLKKFINLAHAKDFRMYSHCYILAFILFGFSIESFGTSYDVTPNPVPPFVITKTYSSVGSHSFTVPQGVTSITVETWGGGGRGGSKTSGSDGSGGGGGGAFSSSVISVVPGQSFVIEVGVGSTSNSIDGGDSWFSPNTIAEALVLARGGKTVANNGTNGGEGGLSSEGVGTIKYSGGNGAPRINLSTSGGGGSSAGTVANGSHGSQHVGGIAPSGGGNGGNGRTSQGSGSAGLVPGGGGGGAVRSGSGSPSGGNGGRGQVLITYTYVADAGEDITQCHNALFSVKAPTPPSGFSIQWSIISGTGFIYDSNAKSSTVHIPSGMTSTIRLTVTDGVISGTDDIVLTNNTGCVPLCTSSLNYNGDLEMPGTATTNNLSFQGTLATLIDQNVNPVGWSSLYNGNTPNTASFTGAYYLDNNGGGGHPFSGSKFLFLAGNGFGVSGMECSENVVCGRTYRISVRIAAYTNGGTQENADFIMGFLAQGSQVTNYQVRHHVKAPASTSWNTLNWQRYSFDVTIPSSYYELSTVFFNALSNTNGIVLDDLCIEEVFSGARADAGEDQFLCSNQFQLSANAIPDQYQGSWSVVSGNATISNPTSPSSPSSITSGTNARLRWTITSNSSQNTIQLIDPENEGSFETGSTLEENGWTSVNQFWTRWATGSSAGSTSGSSAAFVSYFGGASYGYFSGISQTSHFYKDVTIHPEANDIVLSFKWKGMGESGQDRLLVYTAPTGVTPVGGIPSSPSTVLSGATLVSTLNLHTSNNYQTTVITLPNSLAGTNVRLIFTWQNDGADGVQPPSTIDEISLTHKVAVCTQFDDIVLGFNPSMFAASKDTICIGDTATLVTTGCNNGTLEWSTSETTSSINVSPISTSNYSVTCTPNIPSNVLLNPGFESATDLQFWTTGGIPSSITTNSQDVYEGSKAAMINGTAGYATLYQPVDVTPGERYILKVWAKTTNTNKNPKISFQLYSAGWATQISNDKGKKISSSDYEEYTLQFVIPSGVAHMRVYAEVNGGIIYLDKWTLHRYIECVSAVNTEVFVRPSPSAPTITSIVHPTCTIPTGAVQIGGLPATGSWTLNVHPGILYYTGSGATYTVSGLPPDSTFTFSVINSFGCPSNMSVPVQILPIPSDPILSGDSTTCVGVNAIVLPNSSGSWTSSNTAIATITNGGVVSGVLPGNVILTYTRTIDGCDQTKLFDVFANPATPFVGTIIQPTCTTPTGSVTLQNLPSSGNWIITRNPDNFEYTGSGSSFVASGIPPNGNYTFSVHTEHGCNSPNSANLFINPIPTDPVISGSTHVCIGATTQVLPNSNGTWMSSNTSLATLTNGGVVTGILSGIVTLTYTRTIDGCDSDVQFTIYENPIVPVETNIVQPTCIIPTGSVSLSSLPNSGSWTITAFPGNTTYSGSGTTYTISGLTPNTTYTFQVENDKGCLSSLTGNMVINPIPLNPVLSGENTVCVGSTAQVLPSSGGVWTSGNTSIATITSSGEVTGIGGGIVTLTYVRTIDGCQNTKNFEVFSKPLAPIVGSITPPTCTMPTGSVQLNGLPVTGSWTLYTYPGGTTTVGSGPSYLVTNLAPATTFTFAVVDANNCISQISANVVIAPIPSPPILSGDTIICVGSNTNLLPSTLGNWVSLHPSIATISSSGLVTGISPGTASFTYTRNSDGCDQTTSIQVYPLPLTPSIVSIVQPTCTTPTGSVNIEGLPSVGTWTISVNPGGISINGTGETFMVTNLAPNDTYLMNVTDFRGCTSLNSDNIIILDIPEDPVIEGTPYVCINASVQLTPSTEGSWFSDNITVATVNNSGLVSGIAASEVLLTYTRSIDGCSSDLLFTVHPLPLAPGIGQITQPTCIEPTGSVELTGLPDEGDWTIYRIPGNVSYMDSGISTIITGLPPSEVYTFSLVNQYGCLSSASANVEVLSIPTNPVLSGTESSCAGSISSVLPASGGVWSSDNNTIADITNGGVVTAISAGTVTLTFTRSIDGCQTSKLFTVNPLPASDLLAPEVCQVNTLTITNNPYAGLAPFSYMWSGPNGYIDSTQHIERLESTIFMSGIYTVTITDSLGCVDTMSIDVIVNPKATYSVMITDNTVFNDSVGIIDLTVIGGTGPFTFLWSNGDTTQNITNLKHGLYRVTIVDAKGCEVFSEPEFSVGHPADCEGFRTQTQGGWGAKAKNNNSGTYRDANFDAAFPTGLQIGCDNTLLLTSSANIQAYIPCSGTRDLLPEGHIIDTTCMDNGFTGQLIALTLSLGFDDYDPDFCSSTQQLKDLRIGSGPFRAMSLQQLFDEGNSLVGGCGSSYSIGQVVSSIKDANENFVDGKVTGNFLFCCQVNISGTGGTICAGNNIDISALATNGYSPYTYEWSDGLGSGASKNVSPSSTKTYMVTVTDDLGCTKVANVTVVVNQVPTVTLNAPAVCEGATLLITPNITNGAPAFVYNWIGPSGFISTSNVITRPSATTSMAGLYSLTVTDSKNCTASTSNIITIHTNPTVPIIGDITQPKCVPPTGGVTLSGLPSMGTWTVVNSPTGTTYAGSGDSYNIINLLPQQTYTFRVINQNNCTSTFSLPVSIGSIPSDPNLGGNLESCVGSTTYVEPEIDGVWSSSNPSVASVTNGGIVSANNSGSAILTYTRNSDGCDNSLVYSVYINPTAPIINSTIQPTCNTPTGTIELTGLPTNIFWTVIRYPGAIPYQGTGSSLLISGLPISTSYTFRVINENNCVSAISATAIIQGMPVNPILSGPPAICTGATANVLPNANGTWTSSNASIASITNLGLVNGVSDGEVEFTYIRTSDGCINSLPFTVFPNPSTPIVGLITQPTCVVPTGSVHLSGLPEIGNWTITRLPDAIQYNGSGTSYTISNLPPGQAYSFIVRNEYICTSTATVQIVINNIPSNPILGGDDEMCIVDSATILPNTGGTWTSSNLSIATVTDNGEVTGIGSGLVTFTYTRTVDGCQNSKPFWVYSNPASPFLGTVTQPTCTLPFGKVNLQNLPPSGTWTLTIYPGETSISSTGTTYVWEGLLPGGTYYFTVNNEQDCPSSISANAVILPVPNNPTLSGDIGVCEGGLANVFPDTNGIWISSDDNIATINHSGLITGISPGNIDFTYTRTIDGCSNSIAFTVLANPSSPLISQVIQPTCTIPTGSVFLEGLPESGSWTIIRNPGNISTQDVGNSAIIANLPINSIYTFKVIDSKDCASLNSEEATIVDIPLDPILTGDEKICVGQNGYVFPNSDGSWSSSNLAIATINNFGLVSGIAPGLVTLTYVRAIDGCDDTKEFQVFSNPNTPFVGTVTHPTCILPFGSVQLSGLPISGNWRITVQPSGQVINGSGSQYVVTGLSPNTNVHFIIDSDQDCTSNASANVFIQPIPQKPTLSGDSLVCINASIQLSPNSLGTWLGSDNNIATIDSSGLVIGLQSGTATMTYTRNVDGCFSSKIITIKALPNAPVLSLITQPTCIIPYGTIQLSSLPTTGNWILKGNPNNIQKAGSGSSYTLENILPNYLYNFKITDQFGCISGTALDVMVDPIPDNPILSGNNNVCFGESSQVLPSLGGVWNSSEPAVIDITNEGMVTTLGAGGAVLTFTRTDDGCSNTMNFFSNPNPIANINGSPVICSGGWGALEATGGVIYIWNTGANTPTIFVNNSAIYSVTVTNSFGCTGSTDQEITISSDLSANIDYNGSTCLASGDELTAIAQNGTPPYTYQWTGPLGLTGVTESIVIFDNGNYYLTITDAAGCTATTQGYVHQSYDPLIISLNGTVCEGESVQLSVNSSSAIAYNWGSNAGNSTQATVLVTPTYPSSMYRVTVTNDEGCTAVPSIEILVHEKPELILEGPQTICVGDTTRFSSSELGSWESSNNDIAYIDGTGLVFGLAAGDARFIFTNTSHNCPSDSSLVITVQEVPTIILDGPSLICVGQNTQLLSTGNGIWESSDSTIATINSSGFVTGISQGFVEFTFTLENSDCASSPSEAIYVQDEIPLSIFGPTEVCVESNIFLIPNEPSGYWTSSNISIASVNNSGIVTGIDSGNVVITYHYPTGNCTYQINQNILVKGKPEISFVGDSEICVGETTSLTPITEGDWTSSNPSIATILNGEVTSIQPGIVNFTFLSSITGCVSNVSSDLTIHVKPTTELLGSDQICECGSTSFSPTMDGIWQSNNPTVASISNGGIVSGLSQGSASFTYTTSATGCVSEATMEIEVTENPTISFDFHGSICLTDNSQLSVIAQGGSPSYNYVWTGPNSFSASSHNIFISDHGQYNVTVTDNAGCSVSISGTIHERFDPIIAGFNTEICFGESITMTVNANMATDFLWSANAGNSTSDHVTVTPLLPTTVYTVTVTNTQGCEVATQAIITVHPIPVVTFTGPTTICTQENTYIQPVTGGVWASINPTVASISNAGVITGLNEGITRFIYTSTSTGCISDTSNVLIVHTPTEVLYSGPDELCIEDQIQLSPSSGGIWLSSSPSVASVNVTGIVTALSQGVSIFSFVNDVGCTSNTNIPITVNNTPAITLNGHSQICLGTNTYFLPSQGGLWTSTNPAVATILDDGTVTGISEGQSQFLYTNSQTGCTSDTSTWIIVNDSIDIILLGTSEICVGSTTQFSPTSGGLWVSNNPTIADISPSGIVTGLQVGTATFTYISNATQCFVGNSIPIQVRSIPNAVITGPTTLCIGDSTTIETPLNGIITSSNPLVANIGASGNILALQMGSANFTFTDTITGCTSYPTGFVTVNTRPNVAITGLTNICVGSTTTLTPSNGGNWISTDPSVATVTSSGVVTGITEGSSTFVFVESGTGCPSLESNPIFVEALPIVSLTGADEICHFDTSQLSPTTGGSWSSLQPSIASINNEGKVIGLSSGSARFVFTSNNGCVSEPSPWLTIYDLPQIFLTGTPVICIGGQTQFLPSTGGTWTSSKPLIASINNAGEVTGILAGSSRFVFTDSTTGCVSDSTDFVVVNQPPQLALNGPSLICIGQTTNLVPTTGGSWIPLSPTIAGINNNGLVNGLSAGLASFRFVESVTGCAAELNNIVTVNPRPTISISGPSVICTGSTTNLLPMSGGIWTALDPGIATINSSGQVTGVNSGIARFRFTDSSTGCVSSQNLHITVTNSPVISLDGPAILCMGETTQLLPSSGGMWTSTNPTVAEINDEGLVTALETGTAQFYYTMLPGGCQSNLSPTVTVNPPVILSLLGSEDVCIGYNVDLSANMPGVWYSSNLQKATINSSGKVTALAPGKANFYFIESASGCTTYFPTDVINIKNCVDPDFNVTTISTLVEGNVSTNDEMPLGTHYGTTPILISKPNEAISSLVILPDGRYSFSANTAGQYRYLIQVCLSSMSSNCPLTPLTFNVVDPMVTNHNIIPNIDLVTIYKNTTAIVSVLENDKCINSTSCAIDPSKVTIEVPPLNGLAEFRIDQKMEYVPNLDFIGSDTIVYKICAENNDQNCRITRMIIVIKDVDASPSLSATDDFFFIDKNNVLDLSSILLNDNSPENWSFTVSPSGTLENQIIQASGSYYINGEGLLYFSPAENYVGPVDIVYEVCDSTNNCVKATAHILVLDNLKIKARVYLEGALLENGEQVGPDNRPLMRDNLRVNPFTGETNIPVQDPYSYPTEFFDISSEYQHIGQGGLEKWRNIINQGVVFGVTGANAIVDWLFIELRSAADSTLILATRSCLVQRDGDIVDVDGFSDVEFPGVRMDSCFIVIHHRNHLGVMSQKVSTNDLTDFTSLSTPTFDFGTSLGDGYNHQGLAQKPDVVPGYMSLWAGDLDGNGRLKFVNPNDDQNLLFFELLSYPDNIGFVSNFNFSFGYLQGDVDMNGKIKYDNPNDDKNILFYQILFHPLNQLFISNFNNILQQVPSPR
ncbi:MAG: hypothetical protein WAT79_03055 [Saprospiraceae bacterium]